MGRSREVLDEQKHLIKLVLRSSVQDDLIRGDDRDPHARDRCIILPGHGESLGVQRTPRYDAKFTAAVHQIVDDRHPHVRWHLPTLLRTLAWQDRQILLMRLSLGHACATIKQALELGTRFSVDQHVDTLLGELAQRLWTDQGEAVVPGPVAVSR